MTVLVPLCWERLTKQVVRHNFDLKEGVLVRYWKEDVF